MEIQPITIVLSPSEMCENVFLPDLAGERLYGGARMLLLARIDDGLRAQLVQQPAHPTKLRGWNYEGEHPSGDFRFDTKFTSLAGVVLQHDVPHNSGDEVSHGSELHTAVVQVFPSHHSGPSFLVLHRAGGVARHGGGTLSRSGELV
jgi:hypothetical protein